MREKNKELVESITAVTVGPPKSVDVLRTALAMGADSGIHITVPDGTVVEPIAVAQALKKIIERSGKTDLVILGKQAIDDDLGATGGMLAGLTGWSQGQFASELKIQKDGSAEVTREIDGGLEKIATKLPLIVTTDLRLNGE
jgi:electron transfer flavoprotein beta subunit